MRHLKGFTLIELLVVIAIIAIVAAILFPVFAAAKGSGKRTTALSNVKQIGLATHLYVNDYDDRLPFRFPISPAWQGYGIVLFNNGVGGYAQTLGPYIKNSDIWFSPEDRLPLKGYTSFDFNEQLAYDWQLSQIARPAEAIYLTDRSDVTADPTTPPVDTYVWWEFITQQPFQESLLPGTIDPVAVAIPPCTYSWIATPPPCSSTAPGATPPTTCISRQSHEIHASRCILASDCRLCPPQPLRHHTGTGEDGRGPPDGCAGKARLQAPAARRRQARSCF